MTPIHKVSAASGAEWLLRGFSLLGKAFVPLGVAAGLFGLLAGLVMVATGASQGAALAGQVVVTVLTPLVLGALVWGAREVAHARAVPFSGLGNALQGRVGRLLGLLLPQFAAVVAIIVLLLALVGVDNMQGFADLVTKAQSGAQPTPEDVNALPFGRLMLWLVLAGIIGIVTAFCTFTAYPLVVFNGLGAIEAIRTSLRACLRNVGALLVFFLLLVIAAVAINIAVAIVASMLGWLAGNTAMTLFAQAAMMAVLLPVMAGAFHAAWRQMHGGDADAAANPALPPQLPNGSIEV